MTARVLALIICASLSVACGGGGGSSGGQQANPPPPSAPPFGLTVRASLAPIDLPLDGTSLDTYALTNAYPSLSFSQALFAASVPSEDRIIVVRQNGYIEVFDDNPSTATSQTVLDISTTIATGGELGLLGFAFDPSFVQNRYVYLNYTTGSGATLRTVIARMTWPQTTDVIDPSTQKIILEISQPYSNHNAGMLAFGPDDYLYIATGDGGSGGDPQNFAQNMNSLLGKMLRLDVHPTNPSDAYDIPTDNPFIRDANVLDEIYASGLRNPFRFSFDRLNGDLWLGDVGQNQIEEIDLILVGANYGWRVLEGSQPFNNSGNTLPNSAFTEPVYEYDHSLGISVIGGYVYRGSAVASLFGRYLYSDFGSGTVWALLYDGNQVLSNDAIATASSPTSFAQKSNGEVLMVTRNNGLLQFEDSGSGSDIPSVLSQTGLFSDLTNLVASQGLIEYDVNQPFFSDGVSKRRWVGIPDAAVIDFSADDWTLPVGSIAVKHFEINLDDADPSVIRRLETRVLINTSDQGWIGFTYRWNTNGTDANLVSTRTFETLTLTRSGGSVDQLYEYPSPTDCMRCHTDVAGFTLGLKTPQLNGDFNYNGVIDNQLRSFNNIGLFDIDIADPDSYEQFSPLSDTSISVAVRARTYLDVNCGYCHQPGGPTPSDMDLRVATDIAATNTLGVAPASGDLGISNAELIAPGDRDRSILWQRMQRLDNSKMPPLGHHVVDQDAVDLIGNWIDRL